MGGTIIEAQVLVLNQPAAPTCSSPSMQLGSRLLQRLRQSRMRLPSSPTSTGNFWQMLPSEEQYPCPGAGIEFRAAGLSPEAPKRDATT